MGTQPRPHTRSDIDEMFSERFPEGLVRSLEKRFPAAAYADYEDAVATGFVKLAEKITKSGNIAEPRGYVTTVAQNAIKTRFRKLALEQLDADDDDERDDEDQPRGIEWDDPVLDEALATSAYEFMRDLVGAWENASYKQATLLVIEAGRLGEPITNAELAASVSDILDEHVVENTAKQWRKRGLDRLHRELIAANLLNGTEMS